MSLFVYANCWNEMRMLPSFFSHYRPFVDHFFILDDGSTDGSLAFLERQPAVSIIHANRSGRSFVESSLEFWNHYWKGMRDRADWVIACNVDEHVYHSDLRAYLGRCRREGVTLVPADGYEMVARCSPSVGRRLCDEVRFGALSRRLIGLSSDYDKVMIFDPKAIEEIHFTPGRHRARPVGRIVKPLRSELKMLHYKYLGLDYVVSRYAELRTGLSREDVSLGRGSQYCFERHKIRRNYQLVTLMAGVVVPVSTWQDASLFLSFLPWKLWALLRLPLDVCLDRQALARAQKLIRDPGRLRRSLCVLFSRLSG